MKKLGGHILVSLALVLPALAASTYWYYQDAIDIQQRSFDELRELLEPHLTWYLPDTRSPAPALLFFHGCGGLQEATLRQARSATERGYVSIVLDSHTPRHIDWQKNCDGRVLWGQERAADVLVTLAIAREHPAVDPQQLFLVGYSHGAWTVLEALALGNTLPPGLSDRPDGLLDGLRGVVAWYPYCGTASSFIVDPFPAIPVLMLLAEKDEITAPEPCADGATTLARRGFPVRHELYPGVSHGFDRNEDWVKRYDPRIAEQAMASQFAFLGSHGS